MGLGNVVKLTLRCIPYSLFVKLYPIFKKAEYHFYQTSLMRSIINAFLKNHL